MPPRLPSKLTYNDLNGREASELIVDWVRQLLSSHPLLQPHLTLPMADIKIDLRVGVDMCPGGNVPVASAPDHVDINGKVVLSNSVLSDGGGSEPEPVEEQRFSARVNVSPVAGGVPPDQAREQHGLPIPRPSYGPRSTGSHLFLADEIEPPSTKRSGVVAEGYTFGADPSGVRVLEQHIPIGSGEIQIELSGAGIVHESGFSPMNPTHRASVKEAGDQKGSPYRSVTGVIDPGPAGLMSRSSRGGGGLGTDGRSRISFGNNR